MWWDWCVQGECSLTIGFSRPHMIPATVPGQKMPAQESSIGCDAQTTRCRFDSDSFDKSRQAVARASGATMSKLNQENL